VAEMGLGGEEELEGDVGGSWGVGEKAMRLVVWSEITA